MTPLLAGAVRTRATEALHTEGRGPLLERPWLPLLPLLTLPVLGMSHTGVSHAIVASEMILLVMALRNPVWLLGALLLSELTIRNYYLDLGGAQVTARLFISGASLLILLPHLTRGVALGERARPLFLSAAAFAGVATLANVVAADTSYAIEFLRFLLNGFIALALFPLLLRSKGELLRVGLVALVIGSLSAAAGVLQHMRLDGLAVVQVVPPDAAWGGRALGLTENPIYLTNDLMLIAFPVIGVLLARALPRATQYLVFALVLMTIALVFTSTRSWVVSAGPALAVMAFALKGRMGRELIVLLAIAGIGFWYGAGLLHSRYALGPESDSSAATRPVLWNAAFNIALDHPVLGIGHNDQFEKLSPEYADTIDASLLERQNAGDALGRFAPHNDFLNVWVSFGTFGLVAYLAFVGYCWANFWVAARRLRDPLLRGLALGGLGAFVAYVINSSFHNLFDGALTLWILAGLSITMMNFAQREEAPE